MLHKVIKTGNSLSVTIPSKFAKRVGIKAGDNVKSEIKLEDNTIEYTFLEVRQLPLSRSFIKK